MVTGNRRYVYIAVEIGARELDSRVLLGAALAARGASVVLGRRADLQRMSSDLVPGAFVDTNLPVQNGNAAERTGILQRRRDAGVVNVCMDEEGLLYPSGHVYSRMRTSSETMALTDLFVAWGQQQCEDVLAEHPEVTALALGNPRLDLWRQPLLHTYDSAADRIRERHGRYVLFTSNFALAMHAGGPQFVEGQMRSYGWAADEAVRDFLMSRIENVKAAQGRFLEALRGMSAKGGSDLRIVVRPHPADDHDAWRDLTTGLPNVAVEGGGQSTPWILGAQAVVHEGCTSGLEARLAGTRAYTLASPPVAPRSPLDIPDAVSDALPAANLLLLPERRPSAPLPEWLGRYARLDQPSVDAIADAILERTPATERAFVPTTVRRSARGVVRSALRRVPGAAAARAALDPRRAYAVGAAAQRYYSQKCPDIGAEQVADFCGAAPIADRWGADLQVEQLARSVVQICRR